MSQFVFHCTVRCQNAHNTMKDDDFDDIESSNAGMQLVNTLLESTTAEEGEEKRGPGSRPGKRANVERGFEEVASRLHRQYLGSDPVYSFWSFPTMGSRLTLTYARAMATSSLPL